MPFLPPNQQRQSNEGIHTRMYSHIKMQIHASCPPTSLQLGLGFDQRPLNLRVRTTSLLTLVLKAQTIVPSQHRRKLETKQTDGEMGREK